MHQTGAIQAFIFDLDGTLVDTEMLKAQAYLATARELIGPQVQQDKVFAIYSSLVGSTDEDVARALVERLGLGDALLEVVVAHILYETVVILVLKKEMKEVGADKGIVVADSRKSTA